MKKSIIFLLILSVTIVISSSLVNASEETTNHLGEMIAIPAGSFLMGNSITGDDANYSSWSWECPQHKVDVAEFQIGEYEVTRAEYKKFIDGGGYNNSEIWSENGWKWKEMAKRTKPNFWEAKQDFGSGSFIQKDNFPVIGVSWYEAEAYCKWAGGRLPTEAEWEKAARWDESKKHPNIYPWGDIYNANYCNNFYDTNPAGGGIKKMQTAAIGKYPKDISYYGCMDMAGNVWEWVSDRYKSYPNCLEPFDFGDSTRVVKGGMFGYEDKGGVYFRCAYRYGQYSPQSDFKYNGFRVAR